MPSKKKENIIKVECYSGYKADERPVSFISDGKKLMVDRIIDRWRSPDFECYKVQAHNGKGYLIKHDIVKDDWILENIFEYE